MTFDDMTDDEFYAAVEATCSPVAKELARLRVIEEAARNLVTQKGRHNSEIAYKRLVEALTPNCIVTGAEPAGGASGGRSS